MGHVLEMVAMTIGYSILSILLLIGAYFLVKFVIKNVEYYNKNKANEKVSFDKDEDSEEADKTDPLGGTTVAN